MSRLINVQVDIYIYYKHQYLKHIFVSRGHCLYTVGADSDFIEEIPWGIWRSIEVRFITTSETFETSNREFLPENLSQPPTFPPVTTEDPQHAMAWRHRLWHPFRYTCSRGVCPYLGSRRTRGQGPQISGWLLFLVGFCWTKMNKFSGWGCMFGGGWGGFPDFWDTHTHTFLQF